jgi:hypothetical protein
MESKWGRCYNLDTQAKFSMEPLASGFGSLAIEGRLLTAAVPLVAESNFFHTKISHNVVLTLEQHKRTTVIQASLYTHKACCM